MAVALKQEFRNTPDWQKDQFVREKTRLNSAPRPGSWQLLSTPLVARTLKSELYRPHPVRTRQVPRSQTSLPRPDHGSWLGTAAGCELEARRGWCDLKTFHCGKTQVPRPAASPLRRASSSSVVSIA
mgnify:CR=1 FL=1